MWENVFFICLELSYKVLATCSSNPKISPLEIEFNILRTQNFGIDLALSFKFDKATEPTERKQGQVAVG